MVFDRIQIIVCEWQATLRTVKRLHNLKTDAGATDFMLRKLPHHDEVLTATRRSLYGQVWQDEDAHTGKDIMRASEVCKRYLKRFHDVNADGEDALQAWRNKRVKISLPALSCKHCGLQLPLPPEGRRVGGPRLVVCPVGFGCHAHST